MGRQESGHATWQAETQADQHGQAGWQAQAGRQAGGGRAGRQAVFGHRQADMQAGGSQAGSQAGRRGTQNDGHELQGGFQAAVRKQAERRAQSCGPEDTQVQILCKRTGIEAASKESDLHAWCPHLHMSTGHALAELAGKHKRNRLIDWIP